MTTNLKKRAVVDAHTVRRIGLRNLDHAIVTLASLAAEARGGALIEARDLERVSRLLGHARSHLGKPLREAIDQVAGEDERPDPSESQGVSPPVGEA
jgi:hypothetical protein